MSGQQAISWRVPVEGGEVPVLLEPSTSGPGGVVFVCAHGAGGHMDDGAMQPLARELRGRGLDVVRFNQLYRERGSRRPDPMPVVMSTIAAVVAYVRAHANVERLLIGGRSMGGRGCSLLAAEGFACEGLLLAAYPLHPAGKPEKLRDAHLPAIRVPTLCLNGTRDELCRRDLMEPVLARVGANWRMHWLEGADHSFHVLKSSGRTNAEVMRETGDAVEAWLRDCGFAA